MSRLIESCFLAPGGWLLISYSEGNQVNQEERRASAAETFLCCEISVAHQRAQNAERYWQEQRIRAEELEAAIKRLLNHWREFGPEGFNELIESRTLTALGPDRAAQ